MSNLSSKALSILSAVTQKEYGLDPSEVPNEAARMASIVAAAFREAAVHCKKDTLLLLALADELEAW